MLPDLRGGVHSHTQGRSPKGRDSESTVRGTGGREKGRRICRVSQTVTATAPPPDGAGLLILVLEK